MNTQIHLPKDFILQGRYLIERTLGQGGFGITYLATDTRLDRKVAIKELFISGSSTRSSDQTVESVPLEGVSFSDFKAKFIREAKELASIDHPNIVRVYDHFEANGTAYFTMGFVDGKSLQALVQEAGPLPSADATRVTEQLLDALEVIHEKSVLHRDIKPANVMISNRWQVVLIDFGTARTFGDGRTVSTVAMVSQGYSPLEQYGEQSLLDERSDLYSVAATLYYLMTGKKPIEAPRRLTNSLHSVHELNPQVREPISRAVAKAMSIRPEERYASITEFRKAISVSAEVISPKTEIFDGERPQENVAIEMVYVEGGTFEREILSRSIFRKRIVARVTVSSFQIAKYPVTQEQWQSVMGYNPSYFNGYSHHPVEQVSWDDAQVFISKLNELTGKNYRLPTEAEWEFAARGGNLTKRFRYAGGDVLDAVGWYKKNSNNRTHPVGEKRLNELGLGDMTGNVWEWCQDWYGEYSERDVYNPKGSLNGFRRSLRGGSWGGDEEACLIGQRSNFSPVFRTSINGLRLVCT